MFQGKSRTGTDRRAFPTMREIRNGLKIVESPPGADRWGRIRRTSITAGLPWIILRASVHIAD
jgi:hypothetical protein